MAEGRRPREVRRCRRRRARLDQRKDGGGTGRSRVGADGEHRSRRVPTVVRLISDLGNRPARPTGSRPASQASRNCPPVAVEHLATRISSGSLTWDSPGVQRVRAEAASYPADPFLLTVAPYGAPHCSPVAVQWVGDQLIVPAPRHWSEHPRPPQGEPSATRSVCVLYPPASTSGYALIIDGTTACAGPTLTVTITRAVLHRRRCAANAEPSAGCLSDCIRLIPAGRVIGRGRPVRPTRENSLPCGF